MSTEHPNCSISTGIHEHPNAGIDGILYGLTFGSGNLNQYGYWEHPCHYCARAAELRDNVPVNSYWPFKNKNE